MLRRFSSTFNKKKKDEGQVNGTSKVNGTSGMVNGTSGKQLTPPAHTEHKDDHAVKREDVATSLENFAQLLHAARRPLPTQTGDGSYLDHPVPSGLMQDLKNLGFKDVKTLMQVMRTKTAGGYQDDKTYLMERVIQVILLFHCSETPHTLTQQLKVGKRLTRSI